MSNVSRLAKDVALDVVVESIRRDGAVIIEDFLSPDNVAEFRRDMAPYLDSYRHSPGVFEGLQTKRVGAVFAKSRKAADVATHPLFLGAAERLIDTPVTLVPGEQPFAVSPGLRIGVTQVIQIGPGESAQGLHRDEAIVLWQKHKYERDIRLQIMVALTDFTAANGGTNLVSGSHKWSEDRMPNPAEAISTEMKAGSAALFLGSTYHGGGANITDGEHRIGFTMALDSALIRQEENMYLCLSSAVVKSYPEKVRRLLGWDSHPMLRTGWVDIDGEMSSPYKLLESSDL